LHITSFENENARYNLLFYKKTVLEDIHALVDK